jgi:flagellar hook-associated protein 3 FlgL
MVAITYQTMTDEIRRQQKLANSIAADQAAVSSGRQLISPSQDPQSWVQVSELARAQAQQTSWTTNVAYANSRAAKAESNLSNLDSLFTRAQELIISGSSSTLDPAGKTAIVAELQSIRASVGELLNEKDYQGLPVFDDGSAVAVPVSRGINVEAVGTRQSISDGIDVSGTPMSLDDMLSAAVDAVQSGDKTAQQSALKSVSAGVDHIAVQQSVQGVRGNRLEAASERLTSVDLTLSERRSGLEETDLTKTLAGLQSKLTSLEAAQAAFARINKQSLFDLIG